MIDPSARIAPGALVADGATVGAHAQVEHGALLQAGVVIEDEVYVGPGALLTSDPYPRAIVTTGGTPPAPVSTGRPAVVVRSGATIGAGAVVVPVVEIGRRAMVAAGAVVMRSVPAHALVVGNPASRIGWVCACGVRLVDSDGNPAPAEPAHYSLDKALHCPACGRVYTYVPDAETVEEASGPRSELAS